jgi:hypothetical protein
VSIRPLDQHRPLLGHEAAAVAVAVAGALAELHEQGLVHGGVAAHLVRLGEQGDVSLVPADEPGPDATTTDDVVALGALLDWLADRAPDRPAPGRTGLLRMPHSAEVLEEAAHRCRARAPHQPSARQVADTLVRRLPDARLPEARVPAQALSERPQRRPATLRRAAVGALATVALAGGAIAPRCGSSRAVARGPHSAVASTPSEDGTLTVGPHRYAVGEPGDHVLVDRWECGPPAAALLRAATGEVVAFDRLPDNEPVVGRVLLQVAGADHLLARRAAGGCARLAVVTTDGHRSPVAWKDPS